MKFTPSKCNLQRVIKGPLWSPEEENDFFQHAPESRGFGDPIFEPGNGEKYQGPSKIVREDVGFEILSGVWEWSESQVL